MKSAIIQLDLNYRQIALEIYDLSKYDVSRFFLIFELEIMGFEHLLTEITLLAEVKVRQSLLNWKFTACLFD